MRVMRRHGFTIIETMLFLSVSGLLTIGILIGASAAIGAQRYKDAVATLQSDIQQQFEDAVSIKNSRDGVGTAPGCAGDRGQTDCILMGKLMTISSGGAIVQHTVYGRTPSSATLAAAATEYAVMQAYNPAVVPSSQQTSTMEWGTGIAWPNNDRSTGGPWPTTPRNIGIMVIRSPQSGMVYSFSRNSTSTSNLSSFAIESARYGRTICVTTTGWATGDNMSVGITEKASSINAVNVRTNDMTGPGLVC